MNELRRFCSGRAALAETEVVVVAPMVSRPEPLRRKEPDERTLPAFVDVVVVVVVGGATTVAVFAALIGRKGFSSSVSGRSEEPITSPLLRRGALLIVVL